MLVITANNRGRDLQRDDAQEADHVALLRDFTKWSMLVTDVERIPHAMREAFRRALTGCPGPVHLDFTREILEDRELEFEPLAPERYRVGGRALADPAEVRRAAGVLAAAKAPTIWAGRGVLVSRATDSVLGLAEQLEAALVTTFNGIGAIPVDHPQFFGPLSRHGTEVTKRIAAESDAMVVIGNSLNAPSTYRWKQPLPPHLVHVDVDPAMIGRHYPFEVGLTGDAAAVADQLREALPPSDAAVSKERQKRLARLRDETATWQGRILPDSLRSARPIKPQFLARALREALPREAILVAGAGNPGIWSHLYDVYEPGTYMKPVGFGNMGFALPAAIGAKMAQPERPVACLIGDGSLGMCISEIETAVRESAPVLIVVMDNFGYGNIKQEQETHFHGRSLGVDFGDIDFTAIARGFGADGRRVERPEELPQALSDAIATGRTYLLDVVIDPTDNVWTEPF
jgi:acetolactate synthase-1/2/3 large subunit